MYINFEKAHHTVILGTTGTGKTYGGTRSMLKSKKGVLFFNTVHADSVPSEFVTATAETDLEVLDKALGKGAKINFLPSIEDRERRGRELKGLIEYFMDGSTRDNLIFAVDEVHVYKQAAKEALVYLATTGRNFGIKGVYLSQRPARVENDILEMCGQWVCYNMPMSANWFETYGLNGDEILAKLEKAPEYSYVVYNMASRKLEGAFRV